MRTLRKASERTSSEARYPSEAIVHARIGERASDLGDCRRIEIEDGPKLWAYIHDHHMGYDEAEWKRKPAEIMLVFNCYGLAEITEREPDSGLVPIDSERKGHYRFVGRVRRIIEQDTRPRVLEDSPPDDSTWHSVILEAEIPLWCHFYARKATKIEADSVIDVSGEITMELQQQDTSSEVRK